MMLPLKMADNPKVFSISTVCWQHRKFITLSNRCQAQHLLQQLYFLFTTNCSYWTLLRLSLPLTRYQHCLMKDLERMKHSWKSCGKYGKYCLTIIVFSYVWSPWITYQGQKAINLAKSLKQNGLRRYPNSEPVKTWNNRK